MRHPSNEEWLSVRGRVFSPDVLQTDIRRLRWASTSRTVSSAGQSYAKAVAALDLGDCPIPFLYEGKQERSGPDGRLERAADIATRGRMILAGGLSCGQCRESDCERTTDRCRRIECGRERAPGQKDAGLIKEFVTCGACRGERLMSALLKIGRSRDAVAGGDTPVTCPTIAAASARLVAATCPRRWCLPSSGSRQA